MKQFLEDGSPAKIYWTSGKGDWSCYACSIVAVSSEETSCTVHGFRKNVGDSTIFVDTSKME